MQADEVKNVLEEQGVTLDFYGDDKSKAVDTIAGAIADGFRKYPFWNDERRPSEGRKLNAYIFRYLGIWHFADADAAKVTREILKAAGAWWYA